MNCPSCSESSQISRTPSGGFACSQCGARWGEPEEKPSPPSAASSLAAVPKAEPDEKSGHECKLSARVDQLEKRIEVLESEVADGIVAVAELIEAVDALSNRLADKIEAAAVDDEGGSGAS